MIRPFTFVTLMLASTSGAYLFVIKHQAATLDQQISSITGQIRTAEQRIRVLRAEWALENEPSQLAALSKRFLKLKPMEPGQLTTASQLAEILPQPGAGIPRLPLPPLPSWAAAPSASEAAPAVNNRDKNPAFGHASAPVASAAPVLTQSAPVQTALAGPALAAPKPIVQARAPVELAAAHPGPFPLQGSQLAGHHALPPAKRLMPPVQHYAVRHAVHPYQQVAHDGYPYSGTTSLSTSLGMPLGTHGMTAAAGHRPAPRYASAMPYQDQTYQGGPGRTQSALGGFGVNLPPPQPVFRSPQ